jgi:hypothetical protein
MKELEFYADKIESRIDDGIASIVGSGNVVLTWTNGETIRISRNELATHVKCDKIVIFKRE